MSTEQTPKNIRAKIPDLARRRAWWTAAGILVANLVAYTAALYLTLTLEAWILRLAFSLVTGFVIGSLLSLIHI